MWKLIKDSKFLGARQRCLAFSRGGAACAKRLSFGSHSAIIIRINVKNISPRIGRKEAEPDSV